MRLLKIRFKLWNAWRKQSPDGFVTKLLNLFGVITSPSFAFYYNIHGPLIVGLSDFMYWKSKGK